MTSEHKILTAVEHRHGPLHGLIVNWADQWRWKRQLASMVRNPSPLRFGELQMLHERIGSLTLEYTTSEDTAALKKAWSTASASMFTVVHFNDRIWLERNQFKL